MRDHVVDDATFAVVDVETTGIDHQQDAIVEVACVVVRNGREVRSFSSLVDPLRPVPPTAAAVHHLTDEMLRGEPRLSALAPILTQLCEGTVIVAHNAAFDLGFLPMLATQPALCTLRLARHCFPELPGHANQVLRYALSAPVGLAPGVPHRALADAHVTAAVLRILLARYRELGRSNRVDDLLAFAAAPSAFARLPFGQHRRKPLAEVPASYLRWIVERGNPPFDRDVRHTARTELARRGIGALSEPATPRAQAQA
jgi:DNA polymerase III epsilon subunit family exonuclease